MKTQENVMMRMIRNVGAFLMAALLGLFFLPIAGCGKSADGEVWKEEIRLMNGDLIIADRKNRWGDSGDLSAGHGPQTWAEIRFAYKGNQYVWGARGAVPFALQIDQEGRFYIVSGIPYCWAWRERGKPDSYYVVFRYEKDAWVEVAVSDVDVNTVFNLAGSSRSPPGSSNYMPYIKESDWKFKNSTYKPNQMIVPQETPGC